jgi:hypothetical protein
VIPQSPAPPRKSLIPPVHRSLARAFADATLVTQPLQAAVDEIALCQFDLKLETSAVALAPLARAAKRPLQKPQPPLTCAAGENHCF